MPAERVPSEQLASKMREEYKALRALMQTIKEHIAASPACESGRWLEGLQIAFDRLRAHLASVFQAQEAEGYMGHLLAIRPTLSAEIARLKHEHTELLKMADNVHGELCAIADDDRLLCADVCARIQRFMAVVNQHEQRENMITQLVLNEDQGTGD